MQLSKYIEVLQEALKDHGDLEVVYSIDDEGNSFNKVWFDPSAGHYNELDKEYYCESDMEEFNDQIETEETNESLMKINAICIN